MVPSIDVHLPDPRRAQGAHRRPRFAADADDERAASHDTPFAGQRSPLSQGTPRTGADPLRQVGNVLGSTLDALGFTVLVLDAQGLIVHANPLLLDVLGGDLEAIGQSWFDLFLDQPCDNAKRAFARLLAGDAGIERYTLDVRRRDGGHARIHWRNALVRDGDRVVGTASVGEVLRQDRAVGSSQARGTIAQEPARIVATVQAAIDEPDTSMLPLIRLIAEHCARLAEERPEAAAAHIRSEFRVGPSFDA